MAGSNLKAFLGRGLRACFGPSDDALFIASIAPIASRVLAEPRPTSVETTAERSIGHTEHAADATLNTRPA
jgi:hypothetical protein